MSTEEKDIVPDNSLSPFSETNLRISLAVTSLRLGQDGFISSDRGPHLALRNPQYHASVAGVRTSAFLRLGGLGERERTTRVNTLIQSSCEGLGKEENGGGCLGNGLRVMSLLWLESQPNLSLNLRCAGLLPRWILWYEERQG